MTPSHQLLACRWRLTTMLVWLVVGCVALPSAKASFHSHNHLRAQPADPKASVHQGAALAAAARPRRRRLDEESSLEVLDFHDEEVVAAEEENSGEETVVRERESSSSSSIDEESSTPSSSSDKGGDESLATNQTTQPIPAATIAGRETEDPLLAEEDSASTLLLDISLSITAQRFLFFLAAFCGMIWTAWQMSENPDGLYAGLCRSIISAIRFVCRIVTCKACFFSDRRGGAAHRHIPLDTWSVEIE